jgi:osmotically inducible protein OsmC
MIRKSTASWQGNGRDGKGTLTSQSGVLSATNFGYRSRFEDGPGTNAEELLADGPLTAKFSRSPGR